MSKFTSIIAAQAIIHEGCINSCNKRLTKVIGLIHILESREYVSDVAISLQSVIHITFSSQAIRDLEDLVNDL